MRHETQNFKFPQSPTTTPDVIVSTGLVAAFSSDPMDVERYREKTVQIYDATGAWAGSIDLMGSLDGSHWSPLFTAIIAGGFFTITAGVKWLRADFTAQAAGGAGLIFGGFDSRTDGG